MELIAVQRAVGDGIILSTIPPSTLTPDSASSMTSTASDRWINGLWFTSLAFSLVTALLAVLIRQWIQAYVTPVFGTPKEQARVRHFRYLGIHNWHVPLIIGLLPTLLHLSLLLFLLGLIVFLSDMDNAIAAIVGVITALAYAIYFATNLIPLLYAQCPYKTPISTYCYPVVHLCKSLLHTVAGLVSRVFRGKFCQGTRSFAQEPPPSTLKALETVAIGQNGDEVDTSMFTWLCSISSNPSVRSVVAQSLADLRIGFPFVLKVALRKDFLEQICTGLHACFTGTNPEKQTLRVGMEEKAGCYLRAHLQLVSICAGEEHAQCNYLDENKPCYNIIGSLKRSSGLPSELAAMRYTYADPFYTDDPHNQASGTAPSIPTAQYLVSLLNSISIPRHVMISVLQRAVLAVREDSGRFTLKNWPACFSLLKAVYFEQPHDTFQFLQQLLIPAYLCHYTKNESHRLSDPELLDIALFKEEEFDTLLSGSSHELAVSRAYYVVQYLSFAISRFIREPEIVKPEWWQDLCGFISRLNLPQPTSKVQTDRWLSACMNDLMASLCRIPISHLKPSSAFQLNHLLQLHNRLLRLQHDSLLDAFMANDGLHALDQFYGYQFTLDKAGRDTFLLLLHEVLTTLVQVAGSQRSCHERLLNYLFQHLDLICTWSATISCSYGFWQVQSYASELMHLRPEDPRWDQVINNLERSLATEADKAHAPKFIRQFVRF